MQMATLVAYYCYHPLRCYAEAERVYTVHGRSCKNTLYIELPSTLLFHTSIQTYVLAHGHAVGRSLWRPSKSIHNIFAYMYMRVYIYIFYALAYIHTSAS